MQNAEHMRLSRASLCLVSISPAADRSSGQGEEQRIAEKQKNRGSIFDVEHTRKSRPAFFPYQTPLFSPAEGGGQRRERGRGKGRK